MTSVFSIAKYNIVYRRYAWKRVWIRRKRSCEALTLLFRFLSYREDPLNFFLPWAPVHRSPASPFETQFLETLKSTLFDLIYEPLFLLSSINRNYREQSIDKSSLGINESRDISKNFLLVAK